MWRRRVGGLQVQSLKGRSALGWSRAATLLCFLPHNVGRTLASAHRTSGEIPDIPLPAHRDGEDSTESKVAHDDLHAPHKQKEANTSTLPDPPPGFASWATCPLIG
jgi:hypothetical protein